MNFVLPLATFLKGGHRESCIRVHADNLHTVHPLNTGWYFVCPRFAH